MHSLSTTLNSRKTLDGIQCTHYLTRNNTIIFFKQSLDMLSFKAVNESHMRERERERERQRERQTGRQTDR